MDIKKELGKKIQLLRQDKGLSRQAICQDEDILTTRQLQRIEKGENIPNAVTALYLARQLGVTVDDLLDEAFYFLPKEYQELKYQLFRIAHFGDLEKLQEREAILEEIYDTYFDNLPDEEQLTIQLFQAKLDMVMSMDAEFDQGLLDEYFPQVLSKKRLTVNDLLLIKLYFAKMGILQKLEIDTMKKIITLVIESQNYIAIDELFLVQENLMNGVIFYFLIEDYQVVYDLLVMVENLMEKRHDFQDKPTVLMFYWKLALEEKELTKAKELYHQARMLCDLTNQSILKERMVSEWQRDMEKAK